MNTRTAVKKRKKYLIDASDKILGRIASEAAILLRAKNSAHFDPSKLPKVKVVIYNVEKIKVTGRKYTDKIYYSHSGYPGGLKQRSFRQIFEKNPVWVVRKAVLGMLPKNRLQKRMIRNLEIIEGPLDNS